jgi:hypothetical protein
MQCCSVCDSAEPRIAAVMLPPEATPHTACTGTVGYHAVQYAAIMQCNTLLYMYSTANSYSNLQPRLTTHQAVAIGAERHSAAAINPIFATSQLPYAHLAPSPSVCRLKMVSKGKPRTLAAAATTSLLLRAYSPT